MDRLVSAIKDGVAGNEKAAAYEAIQLEPTPPDSLTSASPGSQRRTSDTRIHVRDDDDEDNDKHDEEKTLTGPPISSNASKTGATDSAKEGTRASFIFWVLVNIVATLVIILANKQILSNPTLKGAPTLFVAYHFALTGLTLHIASSSLLNAFERKDIPALSIAPLVIVFAAHTVVTNASLVSLLPCGAAHRTTCSLL